MTFYEAAVEVLRRSGRPLHFKKITEVAIRDELLSHVGKTPESTMEDRLDQETRKDDASWIVRTRPGVYMLKADIAERLNEEAKRKDEEKRKKREEEREARKREEEEEVDELDEDSDASEAEDEDDEDDEDEDGEEDDDEDDDDAVEARDDRDDEDEDEDDDRGRGRRRRRRRGRGRGRGKKKSGEAEAPKKEEEPKKNGRDDDGGGKSRRRGRRGGRREDEKVSAKTFEDLDGQRFDSMAEAAFAVLETAGRKAMRADAIAEVVFDRKLVKFHTHDPEATIESAIVTDNQVRARSGRRPLFAQYREGRWGLTQWGVSDEGIQKEQQILSLTAQLRREAEDQLGAAVARLKPEAFEMVVMTLLERLDYCNLKVSKRTSDGDTYFSADWRRGFSDLRVCVHVAADAEATLSAEAVDELRDTLEHYSATEGIIVHVGEVSKDAVRASRNEEEAKVTIIDRKAFVRLLVDEGIGVRTFQTPLVMVDTAFIDALQR